MEIQEKANAQSFTLFPVEKFIISQIAKQQFEGNESMAVRFIIREYSRLTQDNQKPTPAPMFERA